MIEATKIDETKDLRRATNISAQPNLQTSSGNQPANPKRQTVPAQKENEGGSGSSEPSSKKRKLDNEPADHSDSNKIDNDNKLTTNRSYNAKVTSEDAKKVLSHIQQLQATVQAQRQEIATLRQERQDLISRVEKQQEQIYFEGWSSRYSSS